MRRLLVPALVLLLAGCNPPWVRQPAKTVEVWPVYKVPEAPVIAVPESITPGQSKELDQMIENLYRTTGYIDTLRIIIDTHNAAAEAHNKKVEQDLGVGQKGLPLTSGRK